MSNYNQLKITYNGGSQTAITLTDNYIDDSGYRNLDIVAVEVPEIVEEIQSYAFADNRHLAYIKLNEGVTNIGAQAFQHGEYSAVTIPSTVTYIGWNAFNIIYEQMGDLYLTITCLALAPPILDDPEGITFGNKEFLTIKVPDASVNNYKTAWSEYADVIEGGAQPEPEPTSGFTTKDIAAAYMGTDSVAKIYLGSEVVWPTIDYSQMPLTFEVISGGDIKWERFGGSSSNSRQIWYSKNGGEWVSITSNTGSSMPVISVNDGDIIEFRGTNNTYNISGASNRFNCNCLFNAYGNILSLVYGDNYQNYSELPSGATISTTNNFKQLFKGVSGLTDASNIIMPENTKSGCYYGMFEDCNNLEKAPELPALILESASYQYMFANCSKLNYVKCLATNITANNCTANWLGTVSASGTFVKHTNATWPSGGSGIPTGWTVQDADI